MTKVYKTSYNGQRMNSFNGLTKPKNGIVNTVTIRTDISYQTHLGFGGAFTDAAADVYHLCSEAQRKEIVAAYFSAEGLNYNLGRITVHSSDFSACSRTYVKEDDMMLESFDMSSEEEKRIPFVKDCLANREVIMFAAPWSPPGYMKTNGKMNQGGKLKSEFKQLWAEYYAKFLLTMKQQGINIPLASVQNEPEAIQTWESREVDAIEEALEIRDYLAPTFQKYGLDVKFYLWDHNRDRVVERTVQSLSIEGVSQHVWGIGYHWYCCEKYENLTALHQLFPDKHILLTECCVELAHDSTSGKSSAAGLWEHGERYAIQIINDLNNYSEGYIDWNLLLDANGGPNHAKNFCEAPIMLDKHGDLIYNPSYWYIGHFSRFIKKGAKRVFCSGGGNDIYSIAYLNPNGETVIVIVNTKNKEEFCNIRIDGQAFGVEMEKHSIVTIVR